MSICISDFIAYKYINLYEKNCKNSSEIKIKIILFVGLENIIRLIAFVYFREWKEILLNKDNFFCSTWIQK